VAANISQEDALAPKADLDSTRRRLIADQRQMLQGAHGIDDDLRVIEEASTLQAESFDAASFEGASARVLAAADEALRNDLAGIQSALVRIVKGGYGLCLTCGREIPPKILEQQPAEQYCELCARREEAHAESPVSEAVEQRVEPEPSERPPPEIRDMPDEDVEELVVEELTEIAGDLWRGVDVSYREGVVILRGQVESADHRQIAEQIIEDHLGLEVADELEVMSDFEGEGEDRDDPMAEATSEPEQFPVSTDEQGLEYDPPDTPLPIEKVRRRRAPTGGL
jgi:RNA polymerase-binding transcription factor DksA